MAKQNFLSGGYYGKLGMTVGQRWKNIRTIRSYVIPHNPRTQAQQANRGQFGDCVFYAQIAMQLNYKAPCFVASDKTAWNYRMSTARALQDLGLTELERFPLYPTSLAVPYTISSANVASVIDETHISVTVDGVLPEAERVLTMLLLLPGTENWKERLAVCVGANSEADYKTFTFQLPENLTMSQGMQCRFISCDDTDSTTDLIASSQISLGYVPIDEHEFDTSMRSFTRSGTVFTLTFNEPYQNGTNAVTLGRVLAVNNGVLALQTIPEATLINNNGYFAMVFDCGATKNQNIWAFPSGTAIQIASISSRSSTVIATAESKTIALSSDDVSRTYDNRIASVTRDGTTFTFAYATTAPTSTSGSGSVSIHAVSKGAFVDYTPSNYHATKDNFSFTQSAADETEIYAFPAGSTVTENLTRVSNGVTYSPEYTSAQSCVNTSDLVRTFSACTVESSNDGAIAVFTLNSTVPTKSDTVSYTLRCYTQRGQEDISTTTGIGNDGTRIIVYLADDFDDLPLLLSDCYFKLASANNTVVNGVTYQISNAINYAVESSSYTAEPSSDDVTLTASYDDTRIYFVFEDFGFTGLSISNPSATVEGATISCSDYDENEYNLTPTSVTLNPYNYDMDIAVNGSWDSVPPDDGDELLTNDSYPLHCQFTESGKTYNFNLYIPDQLSITNGY